MGDNIPIHHIYGPQNENRNRENVLIFLAWLYKEFINLLTMSSKQVSKFLSDIDLNSENGGLDFKSFFI